MTVLYVSILQCFYMQLIYLVKITFISIKTFPVYCHDVNKEYKLDITRCEDCNLLKNESSYSIHLIFIQ